MKTCGIYKIENTVNGKVYIGQSVEIEKRKVRHFRELRECKHINIHLQRAYDKYGENSFNHIIIEKCSKEKLDEKEKFWISFYNSNNYNYGYNQDSGGQKGKVMNDDARARIGSSRIYPIGCENPNSILNEEEVTDIKYMLLEGYSVFLITEKYCINKWNVLNIRNLKSYTEVAEEINEEIFKMYGINNDEEIESLILEDIKEKNENVKILKKDIDEMKEIIKIKEYVYLNDVINFSEIGKLFNISCEVIINIAKCKTYKYILPNYNKELMKKYDKNLNSEKHLNYDEIREIKHYLSLGDKRINNKILAKKYNVDQSCISNIKLLKLYRDSFSEYNDRLVELYGNFKERKILSEEEVTQIKELLIGDTYHTHDQLGNMFGVDASQISRIKNLKIYKEFGNQYNNRLIEKFNVIIN